MKTAMDGSQITTSITRFNQWLDGFLVELSRPLLMVGFVCGTVDLFTSGVLARVAGFSYPWAIVQAVAIDGLFFAIWARVKRATWKERLVLVPIGLLLALVAFLVNDILSLQQVEQIASAAAMQQLSINAVGFTHLRAGLVILVSILVALVSETPKDEQVGTVQPVSVPQSSLSDETVQIILSKLAKLDQLEQVLAAPRITITESSGTPLALSQPEAEQCGTDEPEPALDEQIKALLAVNSNLPIREIATIVGRPSTTVHRTLKRLEQLAKSVEQE